MTDHMSRDAGITLIEMLVALAIFSMVGLASFTTLDSILRVQARTDGRLEELARLDRALNVFDRDAAQAAPDRVTLDETALELISTDDASLRRYLLRDAALVRESGTETTETPLAQTLLEKASFVRFRVLDTMLEWHDIWPVEGLRDVARAVEVTIALPSDRTLRRLVPLPDVLPE